MSDFISEIKLKLYDKILNTINESEPREARSTYNKINYVIITLANYYKLQELYKFSYPKDLLEVFDQLFQIGFITLDEKKYISSFVFKYKSILNKLMSIEFGNDIFDLYEEIISLDLTLKEHHYCVVKAGKTRDRLGAYYTSKKFAKKVVVNSLQKYLAKKLSIDILEVNEKIETKDKMVIDVLKKTNYSDLSCGTGHFIISLIEYLFEIVEEEADRKIILLNIYGFDIDLIALQVLKTEIIIYVQDIQCIPQICGNYILGNPLINYERNNELEKIILTFEGYIYSKRLGIKQKEFDNKFDYIVGNPPWEKIRLEDKNFFFNTAPEIAKINKKNDRMYAINKLSESNPQLKEYYDSYSTQLEMAKQQIKENYRLRNSSVGELNSYSLFTELAISFLKKNGFISLIVKSGLITTPANKKIFNYLIDSKVIVSLDDFINKSKIFPIDSRERFTVITLTNNYEGKIILRMLLDNVEQLDTEPGIEIDKEILATVNPNSCMIPNVSSVKELQTLMCFYANFKMFEIEFPKSQFGRLVHLTSHSEYIHKECIQDTIPVYEGKFMEMYDNKFSTFAGIDYENRYLSKSKSRIMEEIEKSDISTKPETRFFIEKDRWNRISKNYTGKYSVIWRSLTSSTNKRTMIASLTTHKPTTQSIQLIQYNDEVNILIIIVSIFNSAIFDYLVRMKLNGIDLTQSIIKQIPVPNLLSFKRIIIFKGIEDNIENHIAVRVKKLYENDVELQDFFKETDVIFDGKLTSRQVILELDCLISIVYQINKKQFFGILESFPNYYSSSDIEYINKIMKLAEE